MKHPGRTRMDAYRGEDHRVEGSEINPPTQEKRYDRFRRRTNEAPNKASAIEVGSGTGSELKTQI